MRFAFIVPESHLELAALSNYHISLPAYYLKSRAYQEFYKRMVRIGNFVILDNGFHEYKGASLDWYNLLTIALDLNPSVLVVPEAVNYDGGAVYKSVEWIKFVKEELGVSWRFMYVLRGKWFGELEEELTLLREADSEGLIEFIGIHKDNETLAVGNLGGRRAIVLGLGELFSGYQIHMLGVYKDPVGELRSFRGLPGVIGCDSSKPWRICSRGRTLGESRPYPPPFDFSDAKHNSIQNFVAGQFMAFLRGLGGKVS